MKLGDLVMTPMGKGLLGDLHTYNKERDWLLNDHSYQMYAVRILDLDRVLYFLPEEIQEVKNEKDNQ